MISRQTTPWLGASCQAWLIRGLMLAALSACGGGGSGTSSTGGGTGGSGGSGGGGGGNDAQPEAIVQSLVAASVLEGQPGQATVMTFEFTLDKPVQQSLEISFSTGSSAKAGVDSTGAARGGAACAAGVDYVEAVNAKTTVAAGASSGRLQVMVCADADFEPNESFNLSWSSNGAVGATVIGVVINDDAGGLNGTGASNVLGGLAPHARDANPLTNASSDGALGFSFDKSQAACVLDKVTGLNWQRAWGSGGKSFAQLQAEVDVANAGSGLCGQAGWRVPTVNELVTLMDLSQTVGNPLNADAMTNAADVMSGEFWSSEQVATASSNAWIISSDNGGVSYVSKTSTGVLPRVRLVNGGAYASGNSRATVCNDPARYRDFGDGTVEDRKTGLMWKKCAEGASGAQCSSTLMTPVGSSSEMVARLNAVNAAPATLGLGYSDWRVPNVKELASLVDRCTGTNLAIDSTIFPNNQSASYVSASYDANNAQQIWYVDFSGGTVAVSAPSNKYLRLVRAGQ